MSALAGSATIRESRSAGPACRTIGDALSMHRLFGASRPKTLFFSWPVGVPAAKIDYEDVRLGLLPEALEAAGAGTQAELPICWGHPLGLRAADYAGMVVGPDSLAGIRAYLARLP